jgi:hypothetical protein
MNKMASHQGILKNTRIRTCIYYVNIKTRLKPNMMACQIKHIVPRVTPGMEIEKVAKAIGVNLGCNNTT